jgi:hypothetical protein
MKMAALTAYAYAPSSFVKIVLQASFFSAAAAGQGWFSIDTRGVTVFHFEASPSSAVAAQARSA